MGVCFLFLQMTNVTPEYVADIIDKFEVSDENKQKGVMGIEGNSLPFLCPLLPFFRRGLSFLHLELYHYLTFPFSVAVMTHQQFVILC